MYCADCEAIDEYFFTSTVFWLFLPTKESGVKLVNMAKNTDYHWQQLQPHIISIKVNEGQIDTFLMSLLGEFEPQELAKTKVTTTKQGEPKLADMARMVTIDTLINRFKSRWLTDSIEAQRYQSHFQPIYPVADTTQPFAYEALFRMQDDRGNTVPPSYVFELAEYSELLFALDLVARRSAVAHYAKAQLSGKLFINFDPTSIYDPSYCLRATVTAINKLGIKPSNVVFEITETHKINNDALLKGILSFYRRSGFEVALDDIGSGWSGLNMLHKFRPDYVKIDMDLIRDLDTDQYKQIIVKHLIEIAHDNSVKVIAEGVETQAEYEQLKLMRADYCQGFFFAKPKFMPSALSPEQQQTIDDSLHAFD